MYSIEQIIQNINNLQTLPHIYSSISDALQDPMASPDKLSRIIAADQVSTFKILKVANSPFYGFRGKIDTISQAILYLGFNEIQNIIFALSVISFFDKNKSILNLKPVDLWAHSIAVGIASRLIGSSIGERNIENYFIAGILHDIGKLVLIEFVSDEYEKVLRLVKQKKCLIKDAEKEVLGFDHCRIGQALVAKWKLPESLNDVILFHHDGVKGKESNRLLASVHIANILVEILELGNSGDILVQQPNLSVWDIIKLPKGFFPHIRNKLIEDFKQTVSLMLVG